MAYRMRFLLFSVAAVALAACASTPTALTPAPVIAAERAFAARAGEIGWIPAFCEYSAASGQTIAPTGLVNAHEQMCALEDDGERNLFWSPSLAAIARSGDFGFTTGPVSFDAARTPRGQYFTVWRRQADGAWRWLFDGGVGPVSEPGPHLAEPSTLPIASAGAGSADAAVAQVSAIENAATTAAALGAHLAADAHVYRTRQTRAYGGAASAELMAFPSRDVRYRLVRTEASAAGDVAFALGEATWAREGGEAQGFFARIWQMRPEGWRIVYDQLVARPQPPPS